jgi:hypothetical protein
MGRDLPGWTPSVLCWYDARPKRLGALEARKLESLKHPSVLASQLPSIFLRGVTPDP